MKDILNFIPRIKWHKIVNTIEKQKDGGFILKKFKRIAYIILLVIIIVLSLTIYTSATKNDGQDQKEKTFSEIKYLESKFIDIFNSMNNIESKNYSISTTELSKESTQKSSTESSSDSGSGGESGGSSSSQSQSSESSGSEQDSEDKKKFELKSNGVLLNSDDINWDNIKSEIERLYSSIPTITLDLYQLDINKEDILGFNKEFDQLTIVIKDNKKEETLQELTKVYEYIPKFLGSATNNELYKKLIETKVDILKGYSKLDSEKWSEISNDIQKAIDTYSSVLTNTQIDTSKQYSINKTYIMLNELQSAVNTEDTSVFLIKYKNLVEEINNM